MDYQIPKQKKRIKKDNTFIPKQFTDISRYKTHLCREIEMGVRCSRGNKCKFAHSIDELRSFKDPIPVSVKNLYEDYDEYDSDSNDDNLYEPSKKKPFYEEYYEHDEYVYDEFDYDSHDLEDELINSSKSYSKQK